MNAAALEGQRHALKGQLHFAIGLNAGYRIQPLAQLCHIGEHGKLIFQGAGQKIRVNVFLLDQPGGEQKSLPDENNFFAVDTRSKFILILTHLGQPAQRGGGNQDAEITGTFVVSPCGDHTLPIAPRSPKSVLGKPELDAFQHGFLVVLIGGKNGPLCHGRDAADSDQAGHGRYLCLGITALLPHRYVVSGSSAPHGQPAVPMVAPKFHSVAGQLLQHPD